MKYSKNHVKSNFGSAYFNSNKTKLKLAKPVKKEPRKERFYLDLGLLFVQKKKYSLISEFNLFKIDKEI